MITKRFHPQSFNNRHLEQMRDMVGTKVKVLVNLKPVERVLKEDADGFYIEMKNKRVIVRPDPEMLNASHLVGLIIK